MPLKTVYIEILSKLHTTYETYNKSIEFTRKIENKAKYYGYSVKKTESFCNSHMCLLSYEVRTNEFDFCIDIVNEKDIETLNLNVNVDKYSMNYIDTDVIIDVFNDISACNISKSQLKKSVNEISEIHNQIKNVDSYEKNFLLMSDLCQISCYINENNEMILNLKGVPKLNIA